MYFNMMPQILINLYGDTKSFKQVTDITSRAYSSKEIRENMFLYDYYDVQEGETPEIIADKLYNEPTLHWVILICNDIIDPVYDWVMTQDALLRHVIDTYGEENINNTHHYEDENGNWVGYDHPNAARLTNYEYEEQVNEEKRTIKILQPIYINSFVNDAQIKLSQQVL